ncbi:reverse transcriptase domain-containing protein [Tanacetum coccineum]|uniref:Reverse transcriptase domain-containing protein n=1 Tax=Tanacetum coccineum TaxID=301880 RepID=A0ABQ5E3T9_9ASTR
MEKEELIVYLAATKETVSAVLMTEREAKQMPIYFVSKALKGPELNYTSMEKLVLALVHATKRLKRVLVKGQILADFIVERLEEDSLDTPMEEEEELFEPWILFTDGSSCADGSGAGLILTNPEGMEFTYALRFSFAHLSKQVLVKELKEKSISEVEVLAVVEEEGDTWMTPIFEYLTDETLPTDMKKARAIRRKSWRFAIINGILYKKSFLGPWLRTETVIPAEIGMPTIRTAEVDLVQNNEALEINLDLLEERREEAAI